MSNPSAKELIEAWGHRDTIPTANGFYYPESEIIARVEKVLALKPETARRDGPDSERWYAKGYNKALSEAFRILNGEEP